MLQCDCTGFVLECGSRGLFWNVAIDAVLQCDSTGFVLECGSRGFVLECGSRRCVAV